MNTAIGFLEYRSIAQGIEATDAVLKNGSVTLLQNTILCPGKYITLISGDVAAVENAIKVGESHDPATFLDSFIIPNVHTSVFSALSGTTDYILDGALGIVETIDATSSILAADASAKAARINLLEIRLARGMGGKGFYSMCGDVSAVEDAVKVAVELVGSEGLLISTSVIAAPHKDLQMW